MIVVHCNKKDILYNSKTRNNWTQNMQAKPLAEVLLCYHEENNNH